MRIARIIAVMAMALGTTALAPQAATAQPDTAPQAECTLAPTDGTVIRIVGLRHYTLHVPPGLTGPEVPLLLSMHGLFGTAGIQEAFTGWSEYAAEHNFIVAYPSGGLGLPGLGWWNPFTPSSDTPYLRDVIEDIVSTYCVDTDRVYADGHSNGAMMAQRLACDASDLFAAVVSYAGILEGWGPCEPARPVAVGLFFGDADTTATLTQFEGSRDAWVGRNGCSPDPASEPVADGTSLLYDCPDDTHVLARVYAGQSHDWPTGDRAQDMRDRMWSFLLTHTLP